MQLRNFEPAAGTLRDFQDFCERLESPLDEPVMDDMSKKSSGQEKGNKKLRRNNNKKDKKYFCMLHEKKNYAQHRTVPYLKKEAENIKNLRKWQ